MLSKEQRIQILLELINKYPQTHQNEPKYHLKMLSKDTLMAPKSSQNALQRRPNGAPSVSLDPSMASLSQHIDFRIIFESFLDPSGLTFGSFWDTFSNQNTYWNLVRFYVVFPSFVGSILRGRTLSLVWYLPIGSHVPRFS